MADTQEEKICRKDNKDEAIHDLYRGEEVDNAAEDDNNDKRTQKIDEKFDRSLQFDVEGITENYVMNPIRIPSATRFHSTALRVSSVSELFYQSLVMDVEKHSVDYTHLYMYVALNVMNTVVQMSLIYYIDYTFFDTILIVAIVITNLINVYLVVYLNINFHYDRKTRAMIYFGFLAANVSLFTSWDSEFGLYGTLSEMANFLLMSYVEASIITISLKARKSLNECLDSTRSKLVHTGKQIQCYHMDNYKDVTIKIVMKNWESLDQNRRYLKYKLLTFLPLLFIAVLVSFYDLFREENITNATLSFCCTILTITSVAIMAASNFNNKVLKIEAMNNLLTGLNIKIFHILVDERWYISVLSFIISVCLKFVRDENITVERSS